MGYPVVLKGFGTTLQHKTERGLVHLNLCDAQSVTMAAESIMAEAGQELEGLLIQPCLTGKREFVAGVVKVSRSRTLLDVVAAFASQPIPKGNRVAILTLGGGWGVLTSALSPIYSAKSFLGWLAAGDV